LKYALTLIIGFLLGATWHLPYKYIVSLIYAEEYGRLVYLCDSAMREHYIAKNTLIENPSKDNIENVEIAEVALLDCQRYDILRKEMLSLGLTEVELSLISLKFIEKHSTDLLDVVEIHEINY